MSGSDPPSASGKKPAAWNNFRNPDSGMDRYGAQRLALAVVVRDILLKHIDVPWIIENGTLLGAWRSGKFIPHDDDFDMAVFFETDKDLILQLETLSKKIQSLLPSPHGTRIETSYANKIEVFDPTYGTYIVTTPKTNGADYHHVGVDIQAYYRVAGNKYRTAYKIAPQITEFHHDHLFPQSSIQLEGEMFQAPAEVETILKIIYGCLSPNAVYNKETGKYDSPADSS